MTAAVLAGLGSDGASPVAGLGEVRGEIGRIGQRLDDHIANHPGPATTSPPGGH